MAEQEIVSSDGQDVLENQRSFVDEARKENIQNAKFSMDTLSKESALGSIAKIFGGIFGITVFLNAINNSINNSKCNKKGFWIYSRTIMEFTTSGILVGYAINHTIPGLIVGIMIGIVVFLIETGIINKKEPHKNF